MLTDLADVLRGAALVVHENRDWQTRGYGGRSLAAVEGVVCHHTAEARTTKPDVMARALGIGRKDLAGPLCHLYLDRFGEWWVVAGGWANHAGSGWWPGLEGNADCIGVEAANDGIDEPWPDYQLDSWVRGVAAICDHYSIPTGNVIFHKVWAPKRKIDPHGLNQGEYQASVAEERSGMGFTPDEQRELKEIVGVLRWYGEDAHTVGDKLIPMLRQLTYDQVGELAAFAAEIIARDSNAGGFASVVIDHMRNGGSRLTADHFRALKEIAEERLRETP